MVIKRILITLTLLLSLGLANAQINTIEFDEHSLQMRVKQIDEFFSRFNFHTNYMGDDVKENMREEDKRRTLLSILNLDVFASSDTSINQIASSFIDKVIDQNIKIKYEDNNWCAMVSSTLSYENKKYDVVFTLKTEQIKDVQYKWVVTDIDSQIFRHFPKEPQDTIFISPAEHGIGFMTLPDTYNLNKQAVGTSFSKDYHRSNLVIFDYLMAIGKVKVNTITKVRYCFFLDDLAFEVEHIEKRQGVNQGWLITKLDIKTDIESNNE